MNYLTVMLLGKSSVGKTILINKILGTNAPTGNVGLKIFFLFCSLQYISPTIKRIGIWRRDKFNGWGKEINKNWRYI